MSQIAIHYCLSEVGRRRVLKDALDYPATRDQVIEIDSDHPCFEAFLERAVVDDDGHACVKYFKNANEGIPQFDDPQSAGSLLTWIKEQEETREALKQERAAWREEERVKRHENALAALKETIEMAEVRLSDFKAENLDVKMVSDTADWVRSLVEEANSLDEDLTAIDIEKIEVKLRKSLKLLTTDTTYCRKQAQMQKKLAEAESWIRECGSDRLRRIVEEGFLKDSMSVYRDERLTQERPYWKWAADLRGERLEPRNVPIEAFQFLDKAREVDPDAKLSYLKIKHVCDDDCSFGCPVSMGEAPRTVWKGYIAVAAFLDREIAFGGPLGD